ncbi:MAG: helix-turn-helix domain-containing protein [Desulfobacterales bacterium]|nr:helix-turn-helix domain-containing protein [Desulfobacterales bacterium]
MVIEQLKRIGLSGKKGRFYLAALELGEAPVIEVAKRADIGRTTAYNILSRLVEEGLLTQIQKAGRTFVVAEDPEVLLNHLAERRRNLVSAMPEIRAFFNRSKIKPRIHFYEGKEGIQTVLNDTLKCQSPVHRGILSMKELLQTPGPDFMHRHVARRIEAGLKIRVIRSAEEDVGDIWKTSKEELREARYAPRGTIFTMTLYIYDDVVAMISSLRENFAVRIESQEFARLQETLFENLWLNSKKV